MSDLTITPEPYESAVVTALIAEVQREYVVRYGGPDETPIDAGEFTRPAGTFLVGRLDGQPVACGGVRRRGPGVAEIKRMYVAATARGRGLSRLMLAALEAAAVELGCGRIELETGSRQPEAIGLYSSSGYAEIPPFGHYAHTGHTRCFAKDLT